MSALSSSTTTAHTFHPLMSNAPRAPVAYVLAFAGAGAQASAKTNELACLTLTRARRGRTTRRASAPESAGSLQLRFSVSKLRATHQLTCETRNVVAISLRAINHDAITLLIHFDGPCRSCVASGRPSMNALTSCKVRNVGPSLTMIGRAREADYPGCLRGMLLLAKRVRD